MSLSKQIIYGQLKDVENFLRQQPKLDEIDEYGYSPLIQTAIVNDIEKGKLLLEAGANVNFSDLTGRTALHWTADNNNLAFTEMLLKAGADPNAYTRAGQPVLVMPLLRRHNEIKQLLYKYGANLNFAQDFINSKLLGHRYELEGRVDIVDTKNIFIEMEFEGFYLEFNLAIVASSLIDFRYNFGGKHLRQHFSKLQVIIQSIQAAAELIKYQQYLIDIKEFENQINHLLNQVPLIIPVASDGHAISLIKYREWLIRCDRGAYGKEHGTVIFYKLGESQFFNKALIKKLLYQRQSKYFIDEGLVELLKLKPIMQLPLPVQISGNCAWANVEAVIPALMFLFLLEDMKNKNLVDIEECKQTAMFLYEEWLEWDRNRELYFCIESFYNANPARKASKAATLASILFQRCDYNNPNDREKAEKILPILTIPEYTYILKSYFTVFSEDKNDERLKNLINFLDDFGVDINKL